jgi:hypothetical protein
MVVVPSASSWYAGTLSYTGTFVWNTLVATYGGRVMKPAQNFDYTESAFLTVTRP